jgi:hypothetical protein
MTAITLNAIEHAEAQQGHDLSPTDDGSDWTCQAPGCGASLVHQTATTTRCTQPGKRHPRRID